MNCAAITITGVGCFAGGVTLARVIRRMMEAYSLGEWKSMEGCRQAPTPALKALQRLVTGGKGLNVPEDGPLGDEDIAGFFLNFENQQLNLSVFTRGRGSRCQKYTASLEEITHLRQSRLH